MPVDSGSYTPETILRRQALADALRKDAGTKRYTHWMQGVGDLGETAAASALEWRNRQQEREGQGKIADMLLGLSGGATQPPLGGPLAAETPAPNVTPGKVYANDEPSPLDPPSGKDRDLAVRTILSEAGNQGPVGMQAVGNVIRNRAVAGNQGGDTPAGVVTAPNQFEPWNTPAGRAKMAGYDPNSPQYGNASAALDRAYTGDDPTNGAQNFFAPKLQAALGRPVPPWAAGGGQTIGDHTFIGGKPLDPAAAGPAMAFNGQPATATDAPPMPAGAPPAAPVLPQQVAQALQGQPPAPSAPSNPLVAKVAEMLRDPNPYVRQMGQQYATQLMQQQFTPPSYDFKVAGDNLYRTDARTGKAEAVAAAGKPNFTVIGEEDGKKIYGIVDASTGRVTPYNPPTGTPGTIIGPDGKPIAIPQGSDRKTFVGEVSRANAKAAAGEMTEAQTNATQFANRMENAEANLSGLESEGLSAWNKTTDAVPFNLGNYLKSEEGQKYTQAKSQFITALLRKESGAAIADTEFKRYEKEFFPQAGDTPEALAQKREARKVAIDAMKKGAGPGYKSPAAPIASGPVHVSTPEEARKLPKGTPIILPDGSQGIVP